VAITVLWVLGITNALNLLDNMDGLAAGAGAIAAATLSAIALMRGDPGTAWLALGLAGACVGFLRYNFPPAKVFLGDAGSLFIGFVLAALTLRLELIGDGNLVHSAIPLLILGVPVFDMILVVLARAREGRPVYVGGRDHGSHRLASIGLSDREVAVAFYGAQAAFCGSALWATRASLEVAAGLILALGLVSLVAVGMLLSVRVQGPGSEGAGVGSEVPIVQST
jgi:UDP-GlcNAc:undecaprenyl-phosphate GlcNAc-1-phosphate transferase